jgi:two-component system chemotaxis response regulator CheB
MAEGEVDDITREDFAVRPANLTCPDCGGPLNRVESADLPRFRCRVGHAHTIASLEASQAEEVEASLWAALRILEERADMLAEMARVQRDRDRSNVAAVYEERSTEAHAHADRIRELLQDGVFGPGAPSGEHG